MLLLTWSKSVPFQVTPRVSECCPGKSSPETSQLPDGSRLPKPQGENVQQPNPGDPTLSALTQSSLAKVQSAEVYPNLISS